MKPIDWRKNAQKWPHLQGINFPQLGKKCKVDLLIGLDYVELHRSLGEIQGERGEPVARLTPLGWTCVGPVESYETSFFTFHSDQMQNVDQTLQKFWEIENDGIQKGSDMSTNDQRILKGTEESIKFIDDHYEVALPWKPNENGLPNIYEMAKKRLESTEIR